MTNREPHILGVIVFLLLMFTSLHSFALVGTVINVMTEEAISGAVIEVTNENHETIGKVVTDSAGAFKIENLSKRAYLYVNAELFEPAVISLNTSADNGDLLIKLNPKHLNLKEVTVTASTSSTNSNVDTYIVTDKLRKDATNAIELINNLPGFTVDPLTENIRTGNLTDLKVLVDGREVSKAYANSINPERIKKVELVRNSSGQFSQYAGYLNIVLKNNFEGYDASIRAQALSTLSKASSNREKAITSISGSKGKWDFYAAGEYGHSKLAEYTGYEIDFTGADEICSKLPSPSHPNINKHKNDWQITLGATYNITRRQTVSAQAIYEEKNSDEDNADMYTLNGISGGVDKMQTRYSTDSYAAALNYDNALSDRLAMHSNITYNSYSTDEHQDVYSGKSGVRTSLNGKKNYVYLFENAIMALTKNIYASVSYEFTWREYITKNGGSLDMMNYRETRHRPVAEIGVNKNKFSGNVGISVLNIHARNTDMSRNTFSLLPRVNLHYEPHRNFTVSLNYYTQTEYPNLDLLSAQLWAISRGVWQSGNPSLMAQTMHYAETRVKILECLTLTYMLRHSKNDISPYFKLHDGPKSGVMSTYTNRNITHQYGAIGFTKELHRDLSIDAMMNYQWYRADYLGEKRRGRTLYFDGSASWNMLHSGYRLGANFFLRDDRLPLPQGTEKAYSENLTLTLSREFFDGSFRAAIVANIPTRILPRINHQSIYTPDFRYLKQNGDYSNRLWLLMVNLSYSISKGTSKFKTIDVNIEAEK